jgi:hypothetical protein
LAGTAITRCALHTGNAHARCDACAGTAQASDTAHTPAVCRAAATDSRRDVKKALQHFSRTRPDIVLQLPRQLLADLASQQYPEQLEKKAKTALARLKADTADLTAGKAAASAAKDAAADTAGAGEGSRPPAHVTGRASTQDVLRAMWALTDTSTAGNADATTGDGSSSSSSSPPGIVAGKQQLGGYCSWLCLEVHTLRFLYLHGTYPCWSSAKVVVT